METNTVWNKIQLVFAKLIVYICLGFILDFSVIDFELDVSHSYAHGHDVIMIMVMVMVIAIVLHTVADL